jgi:hypothetical protein
MQIQMCEPGGLILKDNARFVPMFNDFCEMNWRGSSYGRALVPLEKGRRFFLFPFPYNQGTVMK